MNNKLFRCLAWLACAVLAAGCAPQAAPDIPPAPPQRWELTQQTADEVLDFMQQDAALRFDYNEQQHLLEQYYSQSQQATPAATEIITPAEGEDITARLRSLAAQSEPLLLWIKAGSYTVCERVTLPAAVTVHIDQGALLRVQQPAVLTVQGLLDAPQRAHLFEGRVCLQGQGQVAFAPWFGAKGNGRNDDSAALQAALEACAAVCLPYTAGGYLVSEVVVPQGRLLFGEGARRSVLRAATGSTVMLRLAGSDITLRHLEWRLQDMQAGAAAVLLDNALQPLQNIELRDIYTERGYHIVRDIGGGKPISDLRFYEIDCRDVGDTSFLLRDCAALLYMRHCVTDYNVKTLVYQEKVTYPAYRISGCVGMLLQQCDVLGSYADDATKGNHAFVLQNCAAVQIDRAYCDTLSGMGLWLKQVQYATLQNCGAGLNNDIGLLLEQCSRIDITQFKQFGRWELGGAQAVDGIVLRRCSNVSLDNVQALCNLGHALVLQDSSAVTVSNLTAYLNSGAAVIEEGGSNGNLVRGLSVIYTEKPIHRLVGTDSAIEGLIFNDGGYNPAATGSYTERVGSYTAVQAADIAATVNADAVHGCIQTAKARHKAQADLLAKAQAAVGGGATVLASGLNVRDFGAVGDGVTDDTAAILQALQAGSDIYFPAGSYRITKRIFLPAEGCFTFLSGACLLMEGQGEAYIDGQVRAPAEYILRGAVAGRMNNQSGYVQWFGAVGDGVTDDTAAFTEALRHLNKVKVPYTAGGYLIGQIRFSQFQQLCGEGAKAPLLKAAADVQRWLLPKTGVQLHNLVLDMQAAGDAATCLYFDTAAGGMDKLRFSNLTVLSPGRFVADADSGNRNLVSNVHFDNVTVAAPRAEAFDMTDFFGFVFLRKVTVDYQGKTALHDGIRVRTNYGMVMEDCIVQNSAPDSVGAAYRFIDSWAIWTNRCTARNVGGAGFVTQDIKHCYLMNCTASQTGGLGFDLGGVYYQGYGITATQTAGVLLHDGYYLTLGCLQADGEVLVQGCSTVLLQGVQAEKITERQGDFLLCIQTHDAAVSLQGAHSAYRREI